MISPPDEPRAPETAARLEKMPTQILIRYHERLVRDREVALDAERTIQFCNDTIPMIAAEMNRREPFDCICRTSACGHPASQHTGPGGACLICERTCWS